MAERHERVRQAGQDYQRTAQGAQRNAVRQKRFRIRQATTVTHQGSPPSPAPAEEIAIAPLMSERAESQAPDGRDGDGETRHSSDPERSHRARCHFCGRELGEFTRVEPLIRRARRRRRHRPGGVIP
jgi:hypothetical protein